MVGTLKIGIGLFITIFFGGGQTQNYSKNCWTQFPGSEWVNRFHFVIITKNHFQKNKNKHSNDLNGLHEKCALFTRTKSICHYTIL